MRGRRAKELRRVARLLRADAPERLYVAIPQGRGRSRVQCVAESPRGFYRALKRNYRGLSRLSARMRAAVRQLEAERRKGAREAI